MTISKEIPTKEKIHFFSDTGYMLYLFLVYRLGLIGKETGQTRINNLLADPEFTELVRLYEVQTKCAEALRNKQHMAKRAYELAQWQFFKKVQELTTKHKFNPRVLGPLIEAERLKGDGG